MSFHSVMVFDVVLLLVTFTVLTFLVNPLFVAYCISYPVVCVVFFFHVTLNPFDFAVFVLMLTPFGFILNVIFFVPV